MRRLLMLTLALLLLAACAAPAGTPEEEAPPPQEAPAVQDAPEAEIPAEEVPSEDHVLLALEAPLADGRTLTLEAVGKRVDEYSVGAREVRVYDGTELIQTVLSREAEESFWGKDTASDYTSCWSPEETMEALDLNFDGNTDLCLFAFVPNNMIPYYCWLWDAKTEQYQYAFTLQGISAHSETKELTAEYKSGSAGSQWIAEVYKPDENGDLYLDRVERDTCDFEPEPPSYLDFNRGWAEETWVPPAEGEPISPGDSHWSIEADLVLTRREIPVYETNNDSTISHYTEIWELKDGKLQMTSREEYLYEEQP